MRHFFVFLHKELLELWRTYKGLIVSLVFISLTLMSVLFAKFLPEIMKMASIEGMEFAVSDPTDYDSYVQFIGNIGQVGIIMILIMFGAALIREKKQGTAALLTARGLPRWVIALGKLLSGIIMWSGAYWFSFGICYGLTRIIFPEQTVQHLGLAMTALWFFGVMLLCIASWLSAIFKSSGGPVGITIALLFLLPLADLWKGWAKISPNWLYINTPSLMKGEAVFQDALWPFLIAGVVCVLSIIGALMIFNKNEL